MGSVAANDTAAPEISPAAPTRTLARIFEFPIGGLFSMAHLIIARHAQASFGQANYDQLSPLGEQQSTWLGEYFRDRGLRFSRVMTGTLVRQRETARLALQAMQADDIVPIENAGLNEYYAESIVRAHLGDFEPAKLQREDYREYWRMFRQAMSVWTEGGLPQAQETWQQFGDRVNGALAEAVADTSREDTILVVSSGGAISRAIADLLGAAPLQAIELNLQFRNTGFCELIVGRAGMRLVSFNNLPHLDTAERRASITAA